MHSKSSNIMVSLQQADYISSPARISFSADLLDDDEDDDFISINPDRGNVEADDLCMKKISSIKTKKPVTLTAAAGGADERPATCSRRNNVEFEFLSSNNNKMVSADELFSDGKLLPYWKIQQMERLSIQTNKEQPQQQQHSSSSIRMMSSSASDGPHGRVSWFMDDDPSPRPPKCTVLWKELLRLKKNKPHSSSHLSPSSSSSSSSSSNSSRSSNMDNNEVKKESSNNNLKSRVKRGLERTTSATIRIRPMVNVPVIVVKGSSLPPLFPLKNKGRV